MARQLSLLTFTGKLGSLIGYERNGKYFLRSMPERVKQTTATRRAAKRFGMASRNGALIRHAFYGELDINRDSSHVNRLNKELIAAAGNHGAVTGFRFNQHTGTDRFFTMPPRLFRNGILHIPAQHLVQYKDITGLEVKLIATRIDFKTGKVSGTDTVVMIVDPSSPFTGADIPLDIPGTGTLVVTLQIRGMYKDRLSNNRQYQAADIIAIMETPIPVFFSKRERKQVIGDPENALVGLHKQAYPLIIQRE
jgi:hypothetical protein